MTTLSEYEAAKAPEIGEIEALVQSALDREIDRREANRRLEALQVRGAFEADAYTGYDYSNQRWIVAEGGRVVS